MADTYDLLTLDEGKKAINASAGGVSYDAELAAVITGVSQRIVDLCGPVVNRTFTAETYHGGDEFVILRNAAVGSNAVTTVASLAEYDTSGVATTLTAEDYDTKPAAGFLVEAETGIVWRRSSGGSSRFAEGRRNIVFTYTSGRAATTAAAPPKFKVAAQIMVAHVWRQRGPQAGAYRTDTEGGPIYGVAPFSLPRAVTDMLSNDRRPDRLVGLA